MNSKMLGVVLPGLFGLLMAASACEGSDGSLESDLNAAELRGGNGKASDARCGCNKPADDDQDADEDLAVDESDVDGGMGKGLAKGKDKEKKEKKDKSQDDAGTRGKSDEAKARRDGGIECVCDDDGDQGNGGSKGQSGDHGKPDAGVRGNGKGQSGDHGKPDAGERGQGRK